MSTEQQRQQENDRALRTLIAPGSATNRVLHDDSRVKFDTDGYVDLSDEYSRSAVRQEFIRQRNGAERTATNASWNNGGSINFMSDRAHRPGQINARENANIDSYNKALAALQGMTTETEQSRRINMAFGSRRSDGSYTYGGHDAASQLVAGGAIKLTNGTEYADAAAFVRAQPELAAALRADLTRRANDDSSYNASGENAAAALTALNNADQEALRRARVALMNSGLPVDEYVINRPTTFRVNGRDYTVNGSAESPITMRVQGGVIMSGGPLNQGQIAGFSALQEATEREYLHNGNSGGLTTQYLSSLGVNRRSMTNEERASLMNSGQPVQEYVINRPTTFRVNGRDYTVNGSAESPITMRVQGGVIMSGGPLNQGQIAGFSALQEATEREYLHNGNSGGLTTQYLSSLGVTPSTGTQPGATPVRPPLQAPPLLRNLRQRFLRGQQEEHGHGSDGHHQPALETLTAAVTGAVGGLSTQVALTLNTPTGSIAGSPNADNTGAGITGGTAPVAGVSTVRS